MLRQAMIKPDRLELLIAALVRLCLASLLATWLESHRSAHLSGRSLVQSLLAGRSIVIGRFGSAPIRTQRHLSLSVVVSGSIVVVIVTSPAFVTRFFVCVAGLVVGRQRPRPNAEAIAIPIVVVRRTHRQEVVRPRTAPIE